MKTFLIISLRFLAVGMIVSLLGCGGGSDSKDTLSIDGSTTVYPIIQAMGEDFYADNRNAVVSINKSGTGSGFQKFIRGELDIAAASRPIETKEDKELQAKGIGYIEIPIAYDGVSVIVNPHNTWADHMTTAELFAAWNSASSVSLWRDIRPSFPSDKIEFHGPTDNHGTYEYFTEAINKKKNDLRSDCQKDQEYNSIIQAVAADKDSIAYVGFNYYFQNKDKVRAIAVDSGNGPVLPSEVTISDGSYAPLSRPLFLYVSKKAYDTKPIVKAFIKFALSRKGDQDVQESSYVVLPPDFHKAIDRHVTHEVTGTLYSNVKPGTKLVNLYSNESGK